MRSLFAFNHNFIISNRFFESYCMCELKDLWNSLQDYIVNLYTRTEIILLKALISYVSHRHPCIMEGVTNALPV